MLGLGNILQDMSSGYGSLIIYLQTASILYSQMQMLMLIYKLLTFLIKCVLYGEYGTPVFICCKGLLLTITSNPKRCKIYDFTGVIIYYY